MTGPTLDPIVQSASLVLLETVEELAGEVAARIRRAEPTYWHDGGVTEAELVRSCCSNLEQVFGQLAGRDVSSSPEAPRDTGRRRAEQGVPLPAVLRAFRIGFQFIWEALLRVTPADTETRATLAGAGATVWIVADTYCQAVTDGYRQAVTDRVRRDAMVRAAVVGRLLEGTVAVDSTPYETAAVLRLPTRGSFVVAVAEVVSVGREPLPNAEDRLAQHDVSSAWRLDDHLQAGLVSVRRGFGVGELRRELLGHAAGRLGLSEPFVDVGGTALAFRQAQLACAAAPRGRPAAARYEETLIGALVASSPQVAADLAQRVLGPVLALPAEDRQALLETLRSWMTDGSLAATAERLHLHRNTINYRLRRLEELTERSLRSPAALAEVRVALSSAEIAGYA